MTSPYSFRAIYADTATVVRSGSTLSRPINPPVAANEIANKTVLRRINIYPLPASDSAISLTDSFYLVGGRNTNIRKSGDSVIIVSDTTEGNTLDRAYDQGGPGAGKDITADAGSVYITGKDGLEVYGTNHVLTASTHDADIAGKFENFGLGNAVEAWITSDQNPGNAVHAISIGNDSSSAIKAEAIGMGSAGKFFIGDATNVNNTLEAYSEGMGNAGYFVQNNVQNYEQALKAWNKGASNGIMGIAKEISRRYSPFYKGGVVGMSNHHFGVVGSSDTSSGVLGITQSVGTFYANGVWDIDAGVLGLTTNVSDVDNFGVAGVSTGYGTGVLGIGAGEGHGVIGISGTASLETTASIRGITRESADGSNLWPPHFELHEKNASYRKGKVGVLGQSVKKYGVWGESISGLGVVGTTGRRSGSQDMPGFPAGVVGISYTADGPGILGGADSSYAGFFATGNINNTFPVVKVESAGLGGALEARNTGNKGNAGAFYNLNSNNDSSTVFIESNGTGDALVVHSNGSMGRAGRFLITDPNNNDIAIKATTYGTFDAGYFHIANPNNSRVALYAETDGLGNAAVFRSNNQNNTNPALMIENYSKGIGIQIYNQNTNATDASVSSYNSGKGRAGEFTINSSANPSTGLYVTTIGTGRALELSIYNTSSTNVAQKIYHTGLGRGLDVELDNSSNTNIAVYGYTKGRGFAGYFQQNNSSSSTNAVQVWGNTSTYALQVVNQRSNGNAAYFSGSVGIGGNLSISGNLSKGSGSFIIDHPLDPENKYLYHSFVESPDMKNIYDGVVMLDGSGEAVVELPNYFEALNMDFRYQLTPIGASAPELYIANEINGNKFKISGGKPGMKVSWQVTGIRKDKYAEKNRIQVEVEKTGEERGKYLHPEAFDKPPQFSANYLPENQDETNKPSAPPEMMQHLINNEAKLKK